MMWKITTLILGLVAVSLAESPAEPSRDGEKVDHLPPILGIPDGHEHVQPSLGAGSTGKPLIGRLDGHEGAPSGGSLLGRPDGHEKQSLLGNLEEHKQPLLGNPDEHKQTLVGRPDGHDFQAHDDSNNENNEYVDAWNENDDDINWGETEEGDYYDSDEQQLVRCKRPICQMHCVNGFQTDVMGCPVCKCLDDPCEEMNCAMGQVCRAHDCPRQQSCVKLTAECVAETPDDYPCAIPMCADFCPSGYASDARGCMTCRCNTPETSVVCPEIDCIDRCANGYLSDEHGCTTCSCNTSAAALPAKPACATPMCATDCPVGYRTNENGCMTCDCNDTPVQCIMYKCARKCSTYKRDARGCQIGCNCAEPMCSEKICEIGQVCANRLINFSEKAVCVPKSLCNESRESAGLRAGRTMTTNDYRRVSPECDKNGAFKPLQCNAVQSECWCVDDRGIEIDGTRTSVFVEEHKPSCVRNITVALNIRLIMILVPVENDDNFKPIFHQLTSTLPEYIGSWMLIDKQYITILSADEIPRNHEHDAVLVKIMIRHDGLSDLPSAVKHMKRMMYAGHCKVPLGSSILAPQPDTMETVHKFAYMPARPQTPIVSNEDDGMYKESQSLFEYCKSHSNILIIAGIACVILLLSIIFVSVMISRRRRTHNLLSYEHQRLQNQISTSSEKSLLGGGKKDGVLLVSAERTDDRTALA